MELWLPQLISAIASVAALITAVIVFFTLREMILQRQLSYKPDLVCKPSFFSCSANIQETLTNWEISVNSRFQTRPDKIDDQKNLRHPSIEIFNIGLGAAKNIEVIWQFDYKKAIEFTKKASMTLGFKVFIEDEILAIKGSNFGTYINIKASLSNALDYVLPVSIAYKPATIMVPSPFFDLLALNYIFQHYKGPLEKVKYELPGFPQLIMLLKYFDVGGNCHTRTFRTDPKVSIIEVSHNKNGILDSICVDFELEHILI
jgi:hypothetical protein